MPRSIDNTEDRIDSRDVIARIEELESERDDYEPGSVAWKEAYPDEAEELSDLTALAEEAEGSPDWEHGETLIRDSDFVAFAQELAEELGAFDSSAAWPLTCIDWKQAARELRYDYFAVDFGGVTYWIRS